MSLAHYGGQGNGAPLVNPHPQPFSQKEKGVNQFTEDSVTYWSPNLARYSPETKKALTISAC